MASFATRIINFFRLYTVVEDEVRIILIDPKTKISGTERVVQVLEAVHRDRKKILLIDPGDLLSQYCPAQHHVADRLALRTGREIFSQGGPIKLVVPEWEDYCYPPQVLCCHLAYSLAGVGVFVPADPFPQVIHVGTVISSEEAKVWINQGKIPFLETSTCTLAASLQIQLTVRQMFGNSPCILGIAESGQLSYPSAPRTQ